MSSEELSRQIEALVDNLRTNRDTPMSLVDIAAVTEVLIATMSAFYRSIDTKVYREFRDLSEYILNARHEIAVLQPTNLETDHIPRAGMELDAIVKATEEATNTIMESAEAIMGADPSDAAAFQEVVNDNIMQIFEACSFQDITGQRISKVVNTLSYIEQRVTDLRDLMGITEDEIVALGTEQPTDIDEDKALLRGPSLEGEGIEQSDVDALMGGESEVSAPQQAPTEKSEESAQDDIDALMDAGNNTPDAPKDEPAETDASSQDDIDALMASGNEPEAPDPKAEKPKASDAETKDGEDKDDESVEGRKTSQADIDALFG